jgi:site-specific DNA-methyltransferase (adenine-specific)
MSIVLRLGDCLEVMNCLPSSSIDLTVTSPPYDNLRTYNGYTFDFEGIAKELYRLTKDGGVVVWIVGDATVKGSETGTSFRQALYFMECGFNLHDTMIYQKSTPPLTHKRYEQNFEYMFVVSKGKPKTFNGIKVERKYKDTRGNRPFRKNADNSIDYGFSAQTNTVLKTNVWKIFAGGGSSDKFASKHPAPFPEQLAHDHIISWSNESDTVLDCFLGSGTTGKMAKQLNRNFIGIEISKEYLDIAKERINGHN